MICLGIESTAHTFSIGIVDEEGNVLSNEKASFTTEQGGIHPSKAAQHHVLHYEEVLRRALEKANLKLKDIDLIAVAAGPGLGHCLRVGVVAARSLSTLLKKPIVGVNHCCSHVSIGMLTSKFKDCLTCYVSGANSQLLAFAGGRLRCFGECIDMGLGNFLDSFGRVIGLGFPAGPTIDKLAEQGKNYIDLPYTIKGMDFAFSGILTKLEQLWKTRKYTKEDLCYSVLQTVYAILTEATERAVAQLGKKEVLLTGGVAASKPLQVMLAKMCEERDIKFAVVPHSLAADNGAMIAVNGIQEFKSGTKPLNISEVKIMPRWRTDDVAISWI